MDGPIPRIMFAAADSRLREGLGDISPLRRRAATFVIAQNYRKALYMLAKLNKAKVHSAHFCIKAGDLTQAETGCGDGVVAFRLADRAYGSSTLAKPSRVAFQMIHSALDGESSE